MVYTYRMNGAFVEVQQADGSWSAPQPGKPDADLFLGKVARWAPEALEAERRYGVPASYTLATIHGESGGNPDLGPTFDGGVGLLMLTHPSVKQGRTTEQLKDPATNVDLGAQFMAKNLAVVGGDVPKLASMFNAGGTGSGPHPSSVAPWGYREYQIPSTGAFPYISRVVAVNNYAAAWLGEHTEIAKRDSGGFFAMLKASLPVILVGLGVGAGVVLARGRT